VEKKLALKEMLEAKREKEVEFQQDLDQDMPKHDRVHQMQTSLPNVTAKYVLEMSAVMPNHGVWGRLIIPFRWTFEMNQIITGSAKELADIAARYYTIFPLYDIEGFNFEAEFGSNYQTKMSTALNNWWGLSAVKEIAISFIRLCLKGHLEGKFNLVLLGGLFGRAFSAAIIRFRVRDLIELLEDELFLIFFAKKTKKLLAPRERRKIVRNSKQHCELIDDIIANRYLDGWYDVAVSELRQYSCRCNDQECDYFRQTLAWLYIADKFSCLYEPSDLGFIRRTYSVSPSSKCLKKYAKLKELAMSFAKE
jgi:hypothetical protein